MKSLQSYLFKSLLISLALLSTAGVYFWSAKGLRYYGVQSDSMAPTLRVGDLVINEKVRPTEIKASDIISYISPADPRIVITHRVIRTDTQKGIIVTQGDNLSTADPPVPLNAVVGRSIQTIPSAGYLLDSLKNPLGLIAIIYIPVLVLAIVEFRKLSSRFGNPYKHPNLS